MNYSNFVKNTLLEKIHEMAEKQWLFVHNAHRDFVRKRKLDFETMLKMLLTIESGSLRTELLEFSGYSLDTASVSAFNQQRKKLLPEALEFLFHDFNQAFQDYQTYDGYRLIACDGTDLNIAHNPKDKTTYFQPPPNRKGFNQLHLNALYDLYNQRYINISIQPGRQMNECWAMAEMIDCYKGDSKTIFIADRGYEAYNIFAHVEKREMNYLIRVRDCGSNGMVSSFPLPKDESFDIDIHRILTKKNTNEVKAHPELYKFIPHISNFDYLDLYNNKFYPITFRVVRFPITDNTYECIIKNLDRDKFPLQTIKELYRLRWGIETSFRELKYAIGLCSFHAKKVEYIKQEIYARLILYNVCEIITTHVVITQKKTKHVYQLNYTMAIYICRYFLRCNSDISPPDVEALIQKHLLPVRNGRHDPRKVRPKAMVSFLYRVV